MKYFIIHIRSDRRTGEGYSVLIAIENGDEKMVVEKMLEKGYFDWFEELADIGYVKEIKKTEYEELTSKSHRVWESGCMLAKKFFAKEDWEKIKKLSFENWNKEEAIGFEYNGSWITNSLMDVSGRFELRTEEEVYNYYSRDEDGRYGPEGKINAYLFFEKILGLHFPD